MWYREQIKEAGQRLATLDPNAKELINARTWWKTGTTYSNQDFDILSSLNHAIYRIENAKSN